MRRLSRQIAVIFGIVVLSLALVWVKNRQSGNFTDPWLSNYTHVSAEHGKPIVISGNDVFSVAPAQLNSACKMLNSQWYRLLMYAESKELVGHDIKGPGSPFILRCVTLGGQTERTDVLEYPDGRVIVEQAALGTLPVNEFMHKPIVVLLPRPPAEVYVTFSLAK